MTKQGNESTLLLTPKFFIAMTDFNKLVEDLQYIFFEHTYEDTHYIIADKIRKYIRDNGWPCLDEGESETEWCEEHQIDPAEWGWSAVAEVELLCATDNYDGRDVDWYEFQISFFGLWGDVGVFDVD